MSIACDESIDKDALQHTTSGEHAYAGTETCLLVEDDMQCGHIFFNESTLLLKFFCTFCRETYDNINYFCDHLSQHIHKIGESVKNDEETCFDKDEAGDNTQSSLKDICQEYDEENGKWTDCEEMTEMSTSQSANDETNFEVFEENNEGMIVEELDDADEIAAEVEQEFQQALDSDCIFLEENSCTSDFAGYNEETGDVGTDHRSSENEQLTLEIEPVKTFETVKIPPMNATSFDKKKKKITTVKIIAVKNRIEELYKKIKLEEQKRTILNEMALIEEERAMEEEMNTLAPGSSKENEDHGNGEANNQPKTNVVRKIIGETLITLIPTEENDSTPISNSENDFSDSKNPSESSSGLRKTGFSCPACKQSFPNSFALTVHKRSHYLESKSDIKLAHKCSDCDRLFNKMSEMMHHLRTVHYPNGFICKICNQKLSSFALLEAHVRKVHLTRPFSCEICKKSFGKRESFELHIGIHVKGTVYRCHICGRKYPTENLVKQHLRRHTAQIPQVCVVCGKKTLRITQHMKIHTPRPKRILSCSVCGKVFNFSSGLSHHFKVMHKLPRPPPKPKKDTSSSPSQRRALNRSKKKIVEETQEKEEEAKRVIVELIQNASYTPFSSENYSEYFDSTPPIAREETITAVNSISNDC